MVGRAAPGRVLCRRPQQRRDLPIGVAGGAHGAAVGSGPDPLLHVWLAGVGTLLLARRLGRQRPGQPLGGQRAHAVRLLHLHGGQRQYSDVARLDALAGVGCARPRRSRGAPGLRAPWSDFRLAAVRLGGGGQPGGIQFGGAGSGLGRSDRPEALDFAAGAGRSGRAGRADGSGFVAGGAGLARRQRSRCGFQLWPTRAPGLCIRCACWN